MQKNNIQRISVYKCSFPHSASVFFTFKRINYSIMEITENNVFLKKEIVDGLVPEDKFIGYIKQSTYNFIVSVCGKSI